MAAPFAVAGEECGAGGEAAAGALADEHNPVGVYP